MQLPVRVKHGKSRQILANETGTVDSATVKPLKDCLIPHLGDRIERFFG